MAWLCEHAISFRSINPDDDNFDDLQPLKDLLGDSRIVQLGEQSHGDGTCFETKIRLIKFLHQEMGFDVLAFESGLYDCRRSWRSFQTGDEVRSAAQLGVFGIWTGSAQTSSLWDYLRRQATADRPLELCGFDCQFTGAASSQFLAADIEGLAKTLKVDLPEERWNSFRGQLGALLRFESPEGTYEEFQSVLKLLQDALISQPELLPPAEADFWQQELTSLADHCQRNWNPKPEPLEDMKARDAQMAKNFLWLAKSAFPNRKIIVWGASFHLARNLDKVQVLDRSIDYSDLKQMGQWVHEALGSELFTIGFTAGAGKAGAYFREPFAIESAPAGTFEGHCLAADLQNALVPLRSVPGENSWVKRRLVARPLGYAWMESSWPDNFDAIVFNREMSPSTGR